MEYLLVHFPEKRKVVIDGEPQGFTNETLELDKGHHLVSLIAPPNDFKPPKRTVTLKNTTPIKPREVGFEKA